MYYISHGDYDGDDFVNDDNFVDYDFVDYDDDYHDNNFVNDDESVHYKKPFNNFEGLVSAKNKIVNLINNDNHDHNITLLVSNHRICICENDN